jgi:hypothetical protein
MTTRVLLAAAGLALAAPAEAQRWRNLDVSRQLRDTASHHVRVTYGAGQVRLRAASVPVLYEMRLRYDPERGEAVHSYDPEQRSLRLGLRKQRIHLGGGDDDGKGGELQIDLTRRAPLDLALEMGAVEADLDFTGILLEALKIETGASETRLRFDTLNATRMRLLDIQAGAASIKAYRLANANAEEVRIQGGVGSIELDFDGEWTRDLDLTMEVALGSVSIRVPREVGVRVELQRFLTSFDHDGLSKRGGAWYSENWDTATHRIRIKSQSAFGSFDLDRR